MKSNKEIVSTFIHEAANEHNHVDDVYRYFSERVISNGSVGKKIGIDGLKNIYEGCISIFPDYFIDTLEFEEYKNIVMVKGMVSAHHSQPYKHIVQDEHDLLENSYFIKKLSRIKPKGNKVFYPLDMHFIFDKKKVIFCDVSGADLIDFFQQLGCFLEDQEGPSQHIFCQSLKELSKELRNLSTPPLSPKEIECLCLNLNGFSAKQIGSLMSISHRTVQTHIQHSLDKLQCFNKYQCFEMMYEKGFLPIWQDFFNLLLKRYPSFY